jgi:hypothetical protein
LLLEGAQRLAQPIVDDLVALVRDPRNKGVAFGQKACLVLRRQHAPQLVLPSRNLEASLAQASDGRLGLGHDLPDDGRTGVRLDVLISRFSS